MRTKHFLLPVLFLEFLLILYLILTHRLIQHDTFFCFYSQYFFLNNAVVAGQIPLWVPNLVHGTTAGFWFFIQGIGGILFNVYLSLAPLFQNLNFLPLYYLSIFFEKCILILGVWLLSKKYYSHKETSLFVTASVAASAIWMTEIYHNFHTVYAIALIIYFVHEFIDSKRWRYLFLSCNLFVLQSFDKVSYFVPITALVITLYFIFYGLMNFSKVKRELKHLQITPRIIGALAGMVLSMCLLYWAYHLALDHANHSIAFVDREMTGRADLNSYLSYATDYRSDAARWVELFLGFSLNRDYTIYLGILFIPFLITGTFLHRSKNQIVLILLTLTIFLISFGTIVAEVFYYIWPYMSYFRHLSLLSAFCKLFMCFLAGYGFDRLLSELKSEKISRSFRMAMGAAIVLLLSAAAIIFQIRNDELIIYNFFSLIGTFDEFQANAWLANMPLLLQTAMIRIVGVSLFLMICLFLKIGRYKTHVISALLIFHLVDVYGYAFHETKARSIPLPDEVYKLSEFTPMPYRSYRTEHNLMKGNKRGDIYWFISSWNTAHVANINTYTFIDQLGSIYKTHYWQKPLEEFLDAYSLKEDGSRAWLKEHTIAFPNHYAALKYGGLLKKKIQFYSSANKISSKENIAEAMSAADFPGNSLFIEAESHEHKMSQAYTRLKLDYHIVQFDANRLKLNVEVPGENPIWLMYSDVWHPSWKAHINGAKVKIYKANLAYKALELSPGNNKVEFEFTSLKTNFIYRILSLMSLAWLVIIGFLFYRELRSNT